MELLTRLFGVFLMMLAVVLGVHDFVWFFTSPAGPADNAGIFFLVAVAAIALFALGQSVADLL